MGSPHRPVWLADPALVAEDRSIDEVESVRNWATLPPRRAWSTLGPHPIGTERYAAVTSGSARSSAWRETVKDYVSSILSELEVARAGRGRRLPGPDTTQPGSG
jgi:hypothetical protein